MSQISYSGLNTLRQMIKEMEDRYVKTGELPEYNLVKLATASDGAFASYQMQKDGVAVGETINVPKDFVVKSASIKTVLATDDFGDDFETGDKYIDLIINTVDSSDNTGAEHLRINVKDLFNEYTAGNGINIQNGVISINAAEGNGLSIDSETGQLKMGVVSSTASGAVTPEMMNRWNNAAEGNLTMGAVVGSGNVLTDLTVNTSGELVPTKGITALQESDFVEITKEQVTELWNTINVVKYTVTFNSKGGTEITPQTVEKDSKVAKPEDPEKGTDVFDGWFSDEEYNTAWDFDNDVVTSDITLYAKWTTA